MAEPSPRKVIALNRRARHDFAIEEVVEAGIILLGSEVKSMRLGRADISHAFADEREGDIYLLNAHVDEYKGANQFNHEPKRPRKLLLKKRQISKLMGAVQRKGVTLIPLALYFNARGLVKVELGIAKGKNLYDKRASLKEKEWSRQKSRVLKGE